MPEVPQAEAVDLMENLNKITEAEVLHLTTKHLRLSDFTEALNQLIEEKNDE